MATALDVARFFVEQAMLDQTTVCHLKTQKLLYYAQGYALAMIEAPLFPEPIEAWQYGPVVPNVYHELKGHQDGPITSEWCYGGGWSPPFDDPSTRVLLHVWNRFGPMPPGEIVDATHRERPWRQAYRRGKNGVISNEALADYFGNLRRTLALPVSNVPPKRTYFVRWSEFNRNPAPWLRASRTGAVVHVLQDEGEGEKVRAQFGQHHTFRYYEPDDDVEDREIEGDLDW